jgi:hypothetical protein
MLPAAGLLALIARVFLLLTCLLRIVGDDGQGDGNQSFQNLGFFDVCLPNHRFRDNPIFPKETYESCLLVWVHSVSIEKVLKTLGRIDHQTIPLARVYKLETG